MTLAEAKQHLCNRKLDGNYSDIGNNGLFTDTDLGVWIQLGLIKAWDYKPWDFTEGSKTGTTIPDMITSGYADYPQDIQTGSLYLLRVNGKEFKKVLFQDYLKFQEDTATSSERIWSEQKRFIFINPNAYSSGQTFDMYGKLMPPVINNPTDILPFSPDSDNYEHSGNEAIVMLAYAEALDSKKFNDPQSAEIERGKAYQLLDLIWKPFKEARSLLQSKNRPFFATQDYFGNNNQDSIGNFNYLN